MKRSLVAAVAALSLTSACGSTVALQGQAAVGDGLAPQGQAAVSAPGGAAGPTGPGAVTAPGGPSGVTVGSGGSSTGAPSAVPGAVTGSTGSTGRPVTSAAAEKGPIEVGFITTSVGNAQALGFNPGSTYTDKVLFEALVKDYNLGGGLAGRKIVPVYGETDTANSNWANDFAAVCAKFTQDHKVKVVVGYVFVFLQDFETCLAKAGVPHLYGGYQPGDVGAQKDLPTLVSTGHPTVDGFYLTALEGAKASGLLTKSTKMGLIIDSCANGDRAYRQSVIPWLKRNGVAYETVEGACANGASDVGGASSAVSNAALRFAADGVNLVLAQPVVLLLFMQTAQSQGYSPQYLTGVGGAALEANAPQTQVRNLHGFGWMPVVDVGLSRQPLPQSPAQKACLARLTRQGVKPAAYNDFMAAYQACDGLALYAQALGAAGTTAPGPVVSQLTAALPGFTGTGTYGGGMRFAAAQRGGAKTAREYAWDDSCSCLAYRGPTVPVVSP